MEIYITNVQIAYLDDTSVSKILSDNKNEREPSGVEVSYDVIKDENELNLKLTIPFEQYEKMNYEETVAYIVQRLT